MAGGFKLGTASNGRAEAQARDLLARMTLQEKIGQMTQVTLAAIVRPGVGDGSPPRLDPQRLRRAVVEFGVGSVLNVSDRACTFEQWRSLVGEILRTAAEETRLGIPILYGIDSVHGANYTLGATLFPHNLGLAATWAPDLVEGCAAAAALETRASGIPWAFAPVLDLGRQALWSRFTETFGEDVHLASVMGKACIQGLQGGSLRDPARVAACAKHFIGYSRPNSGKDRTPAWIPEHALRELFLPPFESAVKAGVRTIMVNSGEVNGVPTHADRRLLTGVLREELGFEGVLVSDWEDIIRLKRVHHVASSFKEAVRMAIEAGIDMSMTPNTLTFCEALNDLVQEGVIAESRVDQSVMRILRLKLDLGLFESSHSSPGLAGAALRSESVRLSLQAARESLVLLKNEGDLLPLVSDSRILTCGPGADSIPALHGPWSYTWQGADESAYPAQLDTVFESLSRTAGGSRVIHVPGTGFDDEIDIRLAVEAAGSVDVVLLCLAEPLSVEKPGDIGDLRLPKAQLDLGRALMGVGTPVVLAVLAGRPRLVEDLVEGASAVLWAGYPGPQGGRALAEVLFGAEEPGGRLPFTYPREPASLWTYDHKHSEREDVRLGMDAYQPLFEFGAGFGYTRFEYSGLEVGTLPGQGIEVRVCVRNIGDRAGGETVQLFVADLYASLTPPVRRLKRFRKLHLEAGQRESLEFVLDRRELSFVGLDNQWRFEPGEFRVEVGGLSHTLLVE